MHLQIGSKQFWQGRPQPSGLRKRVLCIYISSSRPTPNQGQKPESRLRLRIDCGTVVLESQECPRYVSSSCMTCCRPPGRRPHEGGAPCRYRKSNRERSIVNRAPSCVREAPRARRSNLAITALTHPTSPVSTAGASLAAHASTQPRAATAPTTCFPRSTPTLGGNPGGGTNGTTRSRASSGSSPWNDRLQSATFSWASSTGPLSGCIAPRSVVILMPRAI